MSRYLLFHVLFTVPVLLVLITLKSRLPAAVEKRFRAGTALLVCLAVLYTTPWDIYLIGEEVWFYGEGVVMLKLFGVPLGEYFFFVIQTLITSVWLYIVPSTNPETSAARIFGNVRLVLPWVSLGLLGAWWLLYGDASYFYLGSILAWGAPVMVVQWGFGGQRLLEEKQLLLKAVTFPTLYLWFVDWVAIQRGLWTISSDTRTGVDILGLPVEEAVFFLATNLMVVQGLILYDWVMEERDSTMPRYEEIDDD